MFGQGLRSPIIDVSVTKNSYILYIFRFLTNPRHRVRMILIYNHRARVVNFLCFTNEDLKIQLKLFLSVSKLASGVYKRGICIAYLHIHCLAGF